MILICAAWMIIAAAPERIGGWRLVCPGGEACLMRLNERFLDTAGIEVDLEVRAVGKNLVPVIVVRGLPAQVLIAAALAGKADASIQFDNGARKVLICSASTTIYMCVPGDDAARYLAAELPTARMVTVRLSVIVDGLTPLPAREKSLQLSSTTEALARLRAAVPLPLADAPPAGFVAMADKMLKVAGFPNGVADLAALLAKYWGR